MFRVEKKKLKRSTQDVFTYIFLMLNENEANKKSGINVRIATEAKLKHPQYKIMSEDGLRRD